MAVSILLRKSLIVCKAAGRFLLSGLGLKPIQGWGNRHLFLAVQTRCGYALQLGLIEELP